MHRPFVLPRRNALSKTTLERIRGRSFRARLKGFSLWLGPLKAVFFIGAFLLLSYVSIVQLRQLFFFTSYFELKKIEVLGLNNLKRDEVVKLAGVAPLMNIFNLDRDLVKSRLLLHPAVKSAVVRLSGLYTLEIVIQERMPLFYCKWGTSFLEISDDGILLASGTSMAGSLPLITGIPLNDKRLGESLHQVDGFSEARNWVTRLHEKTLAVISEINFSSVENPYIFLVSGEKIYPRNLEDFQNRFLFLRALLDNLKKNRVEPEYLDLRAPNEIVVKPRSAKSAHEGGIRNLAGG
jgi:cell division protein FtsQ